MTASGVEPVASSRNIWPVGKPEGKSRSESSALICRSHLAYQHIGATHRTRENEATADRIRCTMNYVLAASKTIIS